MHTKQIIIVLISISFLIFSLFVKNKNYIDTANLNNSESSAAEISIKEDNLKNTNTILYTTEENKIIEYGELFIEFSNYHIVSYTEDSDGVHYTLELDDTISYGDKEITLKIMESRKPSFESIKNMVVYVNEANKTYDRLKVFYNIKDDYGVTAYYLIERDGKVYYSVFYKDKAYEIETASLLIYAKITSSVQFLSYEFVNEDIMNEDIVVAHTQREHNYFENRANLEIIQNKSKQIIKAEIESKKNEHTIKVKNSEGKVLISSLLYGDSFYDSFVKVLDLNRDGYADLQILKNQGAKNNQYELYIYNKDTNDFTKIDIGDYLLSNIEIRDGYIHNYTNDTPNISEVEYFLIENNKLVKKDKINME